MPGFGWYREFEASLPQPFHDDAERSPSVPGRFAQRPATSPLAAKVLPARYSDTARFSAMLSAIALTDIVPVVNDCRIASGVRSFNASRGGVRSFGWSWQVAQFF